LISDQIKLKNRLHCWQVTARRTCSERSSS